MGMSLPFIFSLIFLHCTVLWWNDHMFTDTEFTCRQFFLRSKLEEMAADCATRAAGGKQQHNFVQLPSCPCSPEAMATFMQTEFPFQLDGLLFYCNTVIGIGIGCCFGIG